jgi:hypothetical protein
MVSGGLEPCSISRLLGRLIEDYKVGLIGKIGVELSQLLVQLGHNTLVDLGKPNADILFDLPEIYDTEIEAAAQSAHQRDYMMFGFDSWR